MYRSDEGIKRGYDHSEVPVARFDPAEVLKSIHREFSVYEYDPFRDNKFDEVFTESEYEKCKKEMQDAMNVIYQKYIRNAVENSKLAVMHESGMHYTEFTVPVNATDSKIMELYLKYNTDEKGVSVELHKTVSHKYREDYINQVSKKYRDYE